MQEDAIIVYSRDFYRNCEYNATSPSITRKYSERT